jgi:hypothetical protein
MALSRIKQMCEDSILLRDFKHSTQSFADYTQGRLDLAQDVLAILMRVDEQTAPTISS